MKMFQIGKRIGLFLLVNILVMITINIVALLIIKYFFGGHMPRGYMPLMVLCSVWGMGGAFISLLISRWMAKKMMGVEVIDPQTSDPDEQALVNMVEKLARAANIPMPEVGIYHSPEVNAFATGPSKSQALVAVSSGLLRNMRKSEVEGVLSHEIAHVANGDMVTMTLIQGVINAFVMFLSYILAFAITQAMSSRNDDDERGGGNNWFMQWILVQLFQVVFSLLGFLVVAKFSRWREFRADAGGAKLAGRQSMISALKALKTVHEQGTDEVGQPKTAFQAFKISSKGGGMAILFSTHPPLEDRIARLENNQ
jgi:heat shock protein HtpX